MNTFSSKTDHLNNIPHPPRLPWLGNLHQLSAHNPTQNFMKLMDKYGDILRIYTPLGSVIAVGSHEYTQELCDESRFQKSLSKPLHELKGLGGDGLFTAWTHEANWQKAHNILMPGLGKRAMKGYFPMMLDIAERLMAKWHNIPEGQFFNLTDDMTRLTFDTIGLCGFDYRFHSFASDEAHPFIEAMVTGLSEAMNRINKLSFQNKLRFRANRRYQNSLDYMFKVVDDIIAERQANPEKYALNTDFMSLMLNAKDLESGEKLSATNIRYQIITFLIAGHETTSGLLAFTFYYLMTHPEVLAKAYEEVDKVLGPDPQQAPTYTQVMNLKYIQQILYESLRLWPTAPAFSVYAKEAGLLANRYPIEAKQPFIVLLPNLHRDPAIWGEKAHEFNPDNFSPENAAKIPSEAYKPFGNGQRACIGRQFAMLEATLVVGLVLRKYKLNLKPDYDFKIKETLTLKPDNLEVSLRLRQDSERIILPPEEKVEAPNVNPSGIQRGPIRVLYGSNMGASEDFANVLAQNAEKLGFQPHIQSLDEASEDFPKTGKVLIVSATYNGNPPQNARKFEAFLKTQKPDLKDLSYAVFGCGNTQWQTFQVFPRFIDQSLQELGAQSILKAGEADAATSEFEDQFEHWQKNLWQTLLRSDASEADILEKGLETSYQIQTLASDAYQTSPVSLKENEHYLKVLRNEELLHSTAGRSTRHIEIALNEGLHYTTGGHLGIYPQNPIRLVERIVKRMHLALEDCFEIKHHSQRTSPWPLEQRISYQDFFSQYVELQSVLSKRQLEVLIQFTECPPEKERLMHYQNYFKEEIQANNYSLLDILEKVPACEINLEALLEILPPLSPRYFSISSSALAHAQNISLTVGVISEAAWSGEGEYQGVCTNYLKNISPGDTLRAIIPPLDSNFQLPKSSEKNLLLIGPGTGISPLRAFIQERIELEKQGQKVGKTSLYFGCRHPEQDFLYRDELEAWAKEGKIELELAFSRLQEEKVYVQDLLWKNRAQVWEALQSGSIIYVCGDSQNMAPQVRETFGKIYREFNPKASVSSTDYLQKLIDSEQYREDVWA